MASLLSLLRLRSFDTATREGRSRERYRRVALTALTSVAARSVALLSLLISVPLTLPYLGTERYALWMAVSSLLAALASLDLGIGNGLVTAVAESHGRADREAARSYVSSAVFLLLGLAALALLGFAAAYPFLSWKLLFRVETDLALREAGPATAVFFACVAASVPLSVAGRVRAGYQQGFVGDLWTLLGSLLGLVGLLTAVAAQAGLPWLILGFSGGPVLAALANGGSLFAIERRWLRPRFRDVAASKVRRLLRTGLAFFLLQVASAVAFSSDSLIAAQVLGPQAVTEFAVTARLFTIVGVAVGIALTPLWPAYGEAVARGDVGWVRKALVRSLVATILGSLALSTLGVVFGTTFLRLWVGPAVHPSFALLSGLGVSTMLMTAGNATAMFLNGVQAFRFQVATGTALAVAKVVLAVVLARRLGVAGLAWSTVLAYGMMVAIPMAFFIPRLLARLRRAAPNSNHPG